LPVSSAGMWRSSMTATAANIADRAVVLRSNFDRGFAQPASHDLGENIDLIALRLNAQPFAIRLGEITALIAGKKITRVPGADAALHGIVGSRGALVPVYDLQSLIGLGRSDAPRWLVIEATAQIGLAFDTFEGQLRVSPSQILPQQSRAGAASATRYFLQHDGISRPIIHLPSVIGGIKA
jgi:chemotaxis signal transduction protein